VNNKEFWYADGTETRGPVKFEELQTLYRRQGIGPDTLVWFDEVPDWKPLSQLEGLLVRLRPVPPPLPAKAPAPPAGAVDVSAGSMSPGAWSEPRLPSSAPPALPGLDVSAAKVSVEDTTPTQPAVTPFALDEDKLAKGLADTVPAGAWQRLVARAADGCILGTPVFVFFGVAWPEVFAAEGSEVLGMVLALPLVLLLEAVCVGLFGNSPGKALVGIRARRLHGAPLDFGSATARLLQVWVFGLFFGIPLLGNLTALYQGIRVAGGRSASYDEGRYFVSNRKARWWRTSIVFTFVLLFNVFMILLGVALGQ
jgi:uncharacterized RDD family membrane protein YckC